MAKLALAAGTEAVFDGTTVILPLGRQAARKVAAQGGEPVLVYRLVPDVMVLFLGHGRIARIDFLSRQGETAVELTDYAALTVPVSSPAEARLPNVRQLLVLADGRFAEVVDEGAAGLGGLAEAQAPFTSVETYLALRDQVLRSWDHRCAVTGFHDPPRSGRNSRLEVTAIRPREAGGPLHVSNFLPLAPIAAHAFAHGAISVGPGLDIVAVQNRLEPDLLERMLPSGRLRLPDDPSARPDSAHLTYHRHHIFAA